MIYKQFLWETWRHMLHKVRDRIDVCMDLEAFTYCVTEWEIVTENPQTSLSHSLCINSKLSVTIEKKREHKKFVLVSWNRGGTEI